MTYIKSQEFFEISIRNQNVCTHVGTHKLKSPNTNSTRAFMWSRRDSNPRPAKETLHRLHV